MDDLYVFRNDLNFIQIWCCVYRLGIVFVIDYM
jgi:hypothetical protein